MQTWWTKQMPFNISRLGGDRFDDPLESSKKTTSDRCRPLTSSAGWKVCLAYFLFSWSIRDPRTFRRCPSHKVTRQSLKCTSVMNGRIRLLVGPVPFFGRSYVEMKQGPRWRKARDSKHQQRLESSMILEPRAFRASSAPLAPFQHINTTLRVKEMISLES